MLTDVYTLSYSLEDLEGALEIAKKCAAYCGLEERDALRLRLLTEETVGMMRGVLGGFTSEFYMQADGSCITLHIKAYADFAIGAWERERLVALSSSGENEAYKGFMGKLRKLMEGGLTGGSAGLAAAGGMMFTGVDIDTYMLPDEWSLQRYRRALEGAAQKAAVWDELESSIVARLADEVSVRVHADLAQLQVRKDFSKA